MIRIFFIAFRNQWSALLSQPANFWASAASMLINNLIFFYGFWLMLFDGKPQNQEYLPYFLSLSSIAYLAWGLNSLFLGGLVDLPEAIENGGLEPKIGTPRSPLFLQAISRCPAHSFGDIIQGIAILVAVGYLADVTWLIRTIVSVIIGFVGFAAVRIFGGSLAFFTERGATLGAFFVETSLTFTMYPLGKVFEGKSRLILYLTPGLLTSTLPMNWIESSSHFDFILALLINILALIASVWVFQIGLKRFQSANQTKMSS